MEKNLKFNFTCDDMDGFILIDASYQKIFDSDMLYALDILLDISVPVPDPGRHRQFRTYIRFSQ